MHDDRMAFEEPDGRQAEWQALGREDWEDGEAELELDRDRRSRPDYGIGELEGADEIDQDADDEGD